jgi:hypothetical protein
VEYKKAKARALKNPEDTPTDFIIFSQAHKDK